MDDEGIVRRTSLGGKNGADRVCVQGISPEAVDGFRRESYELAGTEKIRSERQGFFIRRKKKGFHTRSHPILLI